MLDLTRYIGLDMDVWREELEDKVEEWSTVGCPRQFRGLRRDDD